MVKADNLFKAIIENLNKENKNDFSQMLKTSIRNTDVKFQTQLITLLEKYCSKKRTLLINYFSPNSGEKLIELTLEKLTYENGMFYLWGYNCETEELQYIRVDRIKEIKAGKYKEFKNHSKVSNHKI
ncbi:MAG: WYL domain-containing protein [Anaerotruncus sp.]|nr:WYL domain-containing protein [Anaerotruncus sp.]